MNTNFITLDLGTTLGVCISHKNEVDSYSLPLCKSKSDPHVRFKSFERHLKQIILKNPELKTVIYEKVYGHKSSQAAHIYGGFEALLLIWATDNNIKVRHYGVCQIKKAFTGSGKATKEQMKRKAEEIYYEVADDNEADALAIMHLYLSELAAGIIKESDEDE